MKPKESDSNLTRLTTSRTMRQKAHAVARCVINVLKLWRLCFRKKRVRENTPSAPNNIKENA
jgi:hypothetical protein